MIVKKDVVVDDERLFLLSLTDGLAAYAKGLNALGGKEAVHILDSTHRGGGLLYCNMGQRCDRDTIRMHC